MATVAEPTVRRATGELQLITFHVEDLFLGVDINQVREINRQLDIAAVPHAPSSVSGVVNLRGDVVTIVDLRRVLRLPPHHVTSKSRNVVVMSGGESIGLLVDCVTEVVTAEAAEIEPAPSNVEGVDGRYFKGVYKLDCELLVILDVDKVLEESGA